MMKESPNGPGRGIPNVALLGARLLLSLSGQAAHSSCDSRWDATQTQLKSLGPLFLYDSEGGPPLKIVGLFVWPVLLVVFYWLAWLDPEKLVKVFTSRRRPPPSRGAILFLGPL